MKANPAGTGLNTQTENLHKALKNIGLITIMEHLVNFVINHIQAPYT